MDQNGQDAGNPAESSLLGDLGGMTDQGAVNPASSEPANPLLQESGGSGQAAQAFKFAGREYPDQASAEKAWKQLYGKYSESQGVMKTVKEALKNPDLLEALSEDPAWADIFAKLGIESATERPGQGQEEVGSQQDRVYHEMQVRQDAQDLQMEEIRFERELKRDLSPEERRNTYAIIKRASSLSFKEAWQLANHERLLKEARTNGARPQQSRTPGRPAPPPVNAPGSQVNTRKPVNKMNDHEWKENMRNDPEFRELFNRG
jgi:hypothetical protein